MRSKKQIENDCSGQKGRENFCPIRRKESIIADLIQDNDRRMMHIQCHRTTCSPKILGGRCGRCKRSILDLTGQCVSLQCRFTFQPFRSTVWFSYVVRLNHRQYAKCISSDNVPPKCASLDCISRISSATGNLPPNQTTRQRRRKY